MAAEICSLAFHSHGDAGNLTSALIFGDGAGAAIGLGGEAGSAAGFGGGVAYVDSRLPDLGVRLILPRATAHAALAGLHATEDADGAAYHQRRIALGVPDAARDLTPEKSILLENGFDELNAIDWQKGCYMGQELTARTRYRGLVRKRLLPVRIEGGAPTPGTPLMLGDQELGEMRSASADGTLGLAMVRLEALAAFPAGIKQAYSQWKVGSTLIDDKDVTIVQGSNPNSGLLPVNFYFDSGNGLLVRIVRWNETPVGPNPTQIDFDDYRELQGTGVKMPHTWTVSLTYMQMTIKLDGLQANVPVDASRFARPMPSEGPRFAAPAAR